MHYLIFSPIRLVFQFLLIAISFQLFYSEAKANTEEKPKRRPVIALALEGGGALGFAHVGVMKILEEENIPVDIVVGTSMGSIVGAAFASGRTVDEMKKALSTTNWDQLFDESTRREDLRYRDKPGIGREIYGGGKIGIKDGSIVLPIAAVEGDNILNLFHRLFGKVPPVNTFDDLPVRFRAVAADLETGNAVILDRGNLSEAARASMSVPGFFAPVIIDGKTLVDGGIADNLPIDVAQAMGADIVIAIELVTDLRKKDQLNSPLAITAQVLDILLDETTRQGKELLRKEDILIQIGLNKYSATSFAQANEIMAIGEETAREIAPKLRHLSIPEEDFKKYYAHRTDHQEFTPQIAFIEVKSSSPAVREAVEKQLKIKKDGVLDRDSIEANIAELYAQGDYRTISYDIVERDKEYGVVVNAEKKDWLKKYVRLGFALEDDFQGNSSYALAAQLRSNELNSFGAQSELNFEVGRSPLVEGEWYQPLWPGGFLFVAPDFTLSRQQLFITQDDEIVAKYDRDTYYGQLRAGAALGSYGETSIAWRRGEGKLDREIGDQTIPNFDYDIGELVGEFVIDQLNNPDFPTTGVKLVANNTMSRESIGASAEYEKSAASASLPITFGRNTFLFGGEVGYSSNDVPPEQSYSLGGFFDISGYQQGSLLASDYWITRAAYYRQFASLGTSMLNLGGFVGASLEFSSLRSDIDTISDRPDIVSGSVFVGADTPLLPVYLAFGLSDEQEQSFYLAIGRLAGRRR